MGCFSLPCFQSDNFPKWLSDQETPLITNQISIFFYISSFIYIEYYPIFSTKGFYDYFFFKTVCLLHLIFQSSLPECQTFIIKRTLVSVLIGVCSCSYLIIKNKSWTINYKGPSIKTLAILRKGGSKLHMKLPMDRSKKVTT